MVKNKDKLIKIGATAREMLIEAGSLEWQVPRDECVAKGGYVSHLSSGRSFSYGALTEKASSLAPPQEPRIKNRKEYQLSLYDIINTSDQQIFTSEPQNHNIYIRLFEENLEEGMKGINFIPEELRSPIFAANKAYMEVANNIKNA